MWAHSRMHTHVHMHANVIVVTAKPQNFIITLPFYRISYTKKRKMHLIEMHLQWFFSSKKSMEHLVKGNEKQGLD